MNTTQDKFSFLIKLDRVISFIGSRIFFAGGVACVIVLWIVNFVTVVGRHSPWAGAWLTGGHDLSQLLMAMITGFTAAYCWFLGAHLSIGFLRERLGTQKRAVLDAVSAFFFLIWVGSFIWGLWDTTMASLAYGGAVTQAVKIPIAPFQITFCTAMGFFFLVLMSSFFKSIAKAAKRHGEEKKV